MEITKYKIDAGNYVVGRGPCAQPLAVVLHQTDISPAEAVDIYCREPRSATQHQSFHVIVDGSSSAQFVEYADTAKTYNGIEANTNIGQALCGTMDQSVINVGVNWRVREIKDICNDLKSPSTQNLCATLAQVFKDAGLVPSATTLFAVTSELKGLDLTALLECVTDCYNILVAAATDTICYNLPAGNTAQPYSLIACQNGRRVSITLPPPSPDDQAVTSSDNTITVVPSTLPDGQINYDLKVNTQNVMAQIQTCDDTPLDIAADKVPTCAQMDAAIAAAIAAQDQVDDQLITADQTTIAVTPTTDPATGQINYGLAVNSTAVLASIKTCDETAFDVVNQKIPTCVQMDAANVAQTAAIQASLTYANGVLTFGGNTVVTMDVLTDAFDVPQAYVFPL